MAGTYRDELAAALHSADALRNENEALRRENANLRHGAAPPPPRPVRPPGMLALALAASVGVAVLGGVFSFAVMRPGSASVSRPVQAVVAPPPPVLDVARFVAAVRPLVETCRTGLSHTMTLSVTFEPGGRLVAASAEPPAHATTVGWCVLRALDGVRVTPFAGPSAYTAAVPLIL